MSDKVVKIKGEVSVDVNQASQGVDKLQSGVDQLNAGYDNLVKGMKLILQSLVSIAEKIDATRAPSDEVKKIFDEAGDAAKKVGDAVDDTGEKIKDVGDATKKLIPEVDNVADGFDDVGDEVKDTNNQLGEVGKSTDKISAKAEAVKGIWQGVGQVIAKGVVGALNAVWDFVKSSFADGNEWNKLLTKMARDTGKSTAEISAAYVKMASDINASVLDFARHAEYNRVLGGTEESLKAVSTAMENFRYSGMDVNRQLEISATLVKAFNMPLAEQENIIKRVAVSAEKAGISQEKYWNGLVSLGPRMKDLGGTYNDIIALQEAAFQAGIKVEEEGAQGAVQLLENLKNPTDEMIQNFVRLGVVLTENSGKWNSVNAQLAVQKNVFNQLNEEINRYQTAAQAIGLLTREVSMQAEAYKKLEDKKAAGERLSLREARQYREIVADLKAYNRELMQYDELGGITNARDIKKLSLYEQIQTRLQAATKAQEQYNLEADKLSFEAGPLAQQIQMLEAQLGPLMETLRTEVPEAIRSIVSSDEGFASFVAQLGSIPDAMQGMSTETQNLVNAVKNSIESVSSRTQEYGINMVAIGKDFQGLVGGMARGVEKIQSWLESLKVLVAGPLSEAINSVGELFMNYMDKFFGEEGALLGAVNGFADRLKTKIQMDLEAVIRGDRSLMETLKLWIEEAYKMLEPYLISIGEKIGSAIISGMQGKISSGIYNAFDVPGQWLQDKFYNIMTPESYQGVATVDRQSAGGGQSTRTNNVTQNFVINGATDPQKTAVEVSRMQKQAARVGFELGGAFG